MGLKRTQPLAMPGKERLPHRGVLVALINQLLGVVEVALGGVGAADTPHAEIRADHLCEALETALQRPLLTSRKERVGAHPKPVQGGALPTRPDEQVPVGVADREAHHGRISTTWPCPSSTTSATVSRLRIRWPSAGRTTCRPRRLVSTTGRPNTIRAGPWTRPCCSTGA